MHRVLSLLKQQVFLKHLRKAGGYGQLPSQEGPFCSVVPGGRRPAEDFPQKAPLPWRFLMGRDRSALCLRIRNIFLVDRLTVVYISGGGLGLLGKRRLSCAKKARVSC